MIEKINNIQNKITNMNDDEIHIIHKFILNMESNKSEIDNDYYLSFDWLKEINEIDNSESIKPKIKNSELDEDIIKNLALNWRTIKDVPR